MRTMLLCNAIGNYGECSGFINVAPLLEENFDATKESYTLKITAQRESYVARYEVEVSRATDNMPALRLQGNNFGGECPFSYDEYPLLSNYYFGLSLSFAQGSNINNQNVFFTLKSSSGDTSLFELNVSNNSLSIILAQSASMNYGADIVVTIDADFPIFGGPVELLEETANASYYYWSEKAENIGYVNECVYNGDYTNVNLALNSHDSQPEELNNDKIYYIYNSLKVNGSIQPGSIAARFKIDKYSKIYLVADLPHDNSKNKNMRLYISKMPFEYNNPSNNTWTEARSIPSSLLDYWYNANESWTDLNNGDLCYASLSTNIKIFSNIEDAEHYAETGDASGAINGGDDEGGKESQTGDAISSTDIPTVTPGLSGIGTYIYVLSESELQNIMTNCLYNTDTTIVEALKDGLWLWGNNPIDFLIDLYYVPFSISNFYTLITGSVKFGTYVFANAGTFPIIEETSGNRVTLFNTMFEPIYGDWRDFAYVKYDLFLPFIGFVPLDVNLYIGKTVKCEMMFDITTHTIRYYLFANGIITDRFDGSVGINLPLMASDMVNKAKMDIQNARGEITSAFGAVGSVLRGDVGGIAENIANFAQSAAALEGQKTPEKVVGGYSPAMNIYDVKYAYLRITETKHYSPGSLQSVYNYPSYYIGQIGNCTGYCEIEDIQLKSNCTESEYNEIINLLKGGVII